MYDQIKSRVRELLQRSRYLKPQTERHILLRMESAQQPMQAFLDTVNDVLKDYEVESMFGPQFTPDLAEQAEVSELLFHWRPDAAACRQMVEELAGEALRGGIVLSEGSTVWLPLHEVLVERFVRLLRLEQAPEPSIAAAIRDALPAEEWPAALALARQRAWESPERRQWFADFISMRPQGRRLTVEALAAMTDFMGSQQDLSLEAIRAALASTLISARSALESARGGRTYMSVNVAQHHHYRGQGDVDRERVSRKQRDLELLEELARDLEESAPSP